MGPNKSKQTPFWTMKDGVLTELDSTSHQFILDVARPSLSPSDLLTATK